MDYSDALRLMKAGAAMRRAEWRPNKWIAQVNRGDSLLYLQIHITDGRVAPYTPSACDQYGTDWVDASEIASAVAPTKWLARPYEGDTWLETDTPPTPELLRFLEFRAVPPRESK